MLCIFFPQIMFVVVINSKYCWTFLLCCFFFIQFRWQEMISLFILFDSKLLLVGVGSANDSFLYWFWWFVDKLVCRHFSPRLRTRILVKWEVDTLSIRIHSWSMIRYITNLSKLAHNLPSSAFWSHSMNFFICSKKCILPFCECPSLNHLRIASSDTTLAIINR